MIKIEMIFLFHYVVYSKIEISHIWKQKHESILVEILWRIIYAFLAIFNR